MHAAAKYFMRFTPTYCIVLAVAADSAELRAILLTKICKKLQFLCRFVTLRTRRTVIFPITTLQRLYTVNHKNVIFYF